MTSRQRPAELRRAVLDAIGVTLSPQELAILSGRLRFDADQPSATQQQVANKLKISQPHVSNLERDLIARLERAAERRRNDRSAAAALHKKFDAVNVAVRELGESLPPKPRLRIKRSS